MAAIYPTHWLSERIIELNSYSSTSMQPKKHVGETFELYSVPIFPSGKPEIQKAEEIGSSKQFVTEKDILICKINPRINRVWQVGKKDTHDQIASSEWIVFRQANLFPKFYTWYFRSELFRQELCADVSGVGGSLTRAQPKKVATFEIPLPPLAEQKAIADKLDTLLAQVDTTKARLERIPNILKRFRQSVLAAAVSGKLTEEWRGECMTVDDVCINGFDGPFGSKLKSSDYTEYGIRVARLENIGHLKFDNDKKTYIGVDKYAELTKNRLNTGDILFSSFVDETVKVCVFDITDEIFINKADCFCLRPNQNLIKPEFLSYILASSTSYKQIKDQVQGVTRPRINLKILKGLTFEFPILQQQNEIVRRVEELFAFADSVEQKATAALERVNNLTQSILAKAFRGELTADWRAANPDLITGDNSAVALLEKIKAEQDELKKRSKPKKKSAAKKAVIKKI